MRKLSPGDISARLARIDQSPRGRRWRKRARKHLLADVGAGEGSQYTKPVYDQESYVCEKRRYPSKVTAWSALEDTKLSPASNRREHHMYPCKFCKGWHLASNKGIEQ